ncbi:DUF378 domain-containing protein [Neobacillus drentensis]|uniref:DUF378 domain-containing protein n=1 Tax=Neobacillus drentensis TaxID=220684 RepID=UPI001F461AC1|nr:DUF378 domain-containing protein [Neobacillus drentensis]ULT56309.1 DUF378 domain-containing protein [Neobacillus drentensis]
MKTLSRVALVLVIIGAINWGLIGFFQFDLVAALFGGQDSALSRIIYSLVGLSGLACLPLLFAPLGESKTDTTRQNYGQSNYATEFGEENDMTDINNQAKQSDTQSSQTYKPTDSNQSDDQM